LVEAWSTKEAREKLASTGILAEKLATAGRKAGLPLHARVALYRELGALLAAGVPLMRAFELLLNSPELSETRSSVAAIRDRIREGQSLSATLRERADNVPAHESAVIESAERAGTLDRVLGEIAGFMERDENLRERVRAALSYPVIVFTTGICVALVMLGILLPKTQAIFDSAANVRLPWITSFFLSMGSILRTWGTGFLVLLAGVAGVIVARVRRSEIARRRLDRTVLSLPLLGKGARLLVNLRFARTLAMVLDGGVSLVDGFLLAGRSSGNSWVEHAVMGASDELKHGARASEVLGRIEPLSGLLAGYVGVGESTGDLKRMLNQVADRYLSRWEVFVTRSLGILEPALIIAVGAFVLLVALAVLLPILSMSQVLGR